MASLPRRELPLGAKVPGRALANLKHQTALLIIIGPASDFDVR
jgi:hypothetical protein